MVILLRLSCIYALPFLLGFTQVQSEGLVTILVKLGSEQKGQLHSKDLVSENIKYYYYFANHCTLGFIRFEIQSTN